MARPQNAEPWSGLTLPLLKERQRGEAVRQNEKTVMRRQGWEEQRQIWEKVPERERRNMGTMNGTA